MTVIALGLLVLGIWAASALARCPVVYCERRIESVTVDNQSGSVVIVQERDRAPGLHPAEPDDLGTTVPGGGTTYLPLPPVGADGCSTTTLVAVTVRGQEVSTLDRPCDRDTWVIPAVPGQVPAQHVGRAGLPPDQVEVRLIVGLSDSNHPVAWLRTLDGNAANLRKALASSGAGSAEGPYEERFLMVFYLYGPDPQRLLDVARTSLFETARPDDAYADVGGPGQRATPTGVRLNLLPTPPRPSYRPPPTTQAPGHPLRH